jgi:6-phosphogluconolactonase/glucosamine-6-phosphate isomerase/deaminase
MDIRICKDAGEVAGSANQWVMDLIRPAHHNPLYHPLRSLYIPAGDTPKPLYRLWREQKPAELQAIRLIQIDEVLSGLKARCFKKFLEQELPYNTAQLQFFNQGSDQADAAILGLGLNGHVAFHEPGLKQNFFSGCVLLSDITCRRLDLAPGTWGGTYGLGAFLKCKSILLLVTGASKKQIFHQFIEGKGEFPAMGLRQHSGLTVLADSACAPS